MTNEEIFDLLKNQFPDVELALDENEPVPLLIVSRDDLVKICAYLRDEESLDFKSLMCLTGIDTGEGLETVYNLFSMTKGHKFSLRCAVSTEDPVIPSVSSIWSTAEWHERESYDLIGITYSNHPDPRRILCPDDWDGHPLRKDYVPQDEWHGIPLLTVLPAGGRDAS